MKYLYLHGLGQNADSWNQVTRAAEELDNSVCVDLAKMVKGKKVTYSTLYSTFSEMCDSENEGITLCGLSLGGVLALNYAIDHPQKVKALVLIAAQYKMPVRLLKLDFNDSLNQVSCPVLVICGEKDKANKKASIELAHSLKYSQFKEIPETGHEVNLESPEKLASLLQEFYNSI